MKQKNIDSPAKCPAHQQNAGVMKKTVKIVTETTQENPLACHAVCKGNVMKQSTNVAPPLIDQSMFWRSAFELNSRNSSSFAAF